ncbi:MAG: glycosyl transferase group 1 [Holophagaceae bacterium]|nr:glycosyl transferase group 1 [Holophagaceae bacterium]
MRVLWVVNTIFPDLAIQLGMPPPVLGGWMYGLASDITASGQVKLAVATGYPGRKRIALSLKGIDYFLTPSSQPQAWRAVAEEFRPDLIHIHGTEFGHGMGLMQARPDLKYAVSIQGLVSVCHRYYTAGMTWWDLVSNVTLRDILRMDTLLHGRHSFYKRGLREKEYLRRASAVIGRTDWDRSHLSAINPKAHYFFCQESLRDEFYTGPHWSLDRCRRHSIFLSQGAYPLKGLHQVIKAIALLKTEFPDILIEVAGPDITADNTLRTRLRRSGYGKYVHRLIDRLGLERHIRFLGPLAAEPMKQAYTRAHLFVCPSSIENSPNSLGEAQILGVPTIASFVGGTPSMAGSRSRTIFYPFAEFEMLAHYIRKLFLDDVLAQNISKENIQSAHERHDRSRNLSDMVAIYRHLHPEK